MARGVIGLGGVPVGSEYRPGFLFDNDGGKSAELTVILCIS